MVHTRNYRWLVLHGSLNTAAIQLTAVTTVMPFIASELGGSAFIVSLFVPLFTGTAVLGNMLAANILRLGIPIVGVLCGLAAVQALLAAVYVAGIYFLPPGLSVYALLATTAAIGITAGSFTVLLPVAISEILPARERGDMLLHAAGYGAALVTVISIVSVGFLSNDSVHLEDLDLLCIGSAAMALSATCFLWLHPDARSLAIPATHTRDAFRDGITYMRAHRWFRQYLLTNLIFRGVVFGSMFFSIYSSRTLGLDNGGLDSILMFVGLGLLLGVPLWRRVRKQLQARGMYLCSATCCAAGFALCMVLLHFLTLPSVWVFGGAMFLTAMANQGINPASQDWIFSHASDDDRMVAVGFSQLVVNVAMMPIGFGVGLLASFGPATWPLAVMLGISVAAAAAATRMGPTYNHSPVPMEPEVGVILDQ